MTAPRICRSAPSICECGQMGFIGFPRGRVSFFDPEDLPIIQSAAWQSPGKGRHTYVVCSSPRTTYLHRMIARPPAGQMVDHINGDPLDNRKSNLRLCSSAENQWNTRTKTNRTSAYKGVHRRKDGRWMAEIRTRNGRLRLGSFSQEIEAARAYDAAATEHHREFARTNAALGLLPKD